SRGRADAAIQRVVDERSPIRRDRRRAGTRVAVRRAMRIRFDRGTLVLEAEHAHEDPARVPGTRWDERLQAWRVPACAYRELAAVGATGPARLADAWEVPPLRWYQEAAIERWLAAGSRGVVALPTGSGKTVVALAAIARLGVA